MSAHRGTSNANDRGSSKDRARRRAYLLATYASDVQVLLVHNVGDDEDRYVYPNDADDQAFLQAYLEEGGVAYEVLATCRCFRCGRLLIDATLTADRIKPGVEGGSYCRENIRPACGPCNSSTGSKLGHERRKARRKTARS